MQPGWSHGWGRLSGRSPLTSNDARSSCDITQVWRLRPRLASRDGASTWTSHRPSYEGAIPPASGSLGKGSGDNGRGGGDPRQAHGRSRADAARGRRRLRATGAPGSAGWSEPARPSPPTLWSARRGLSSKNYSFRITTRGCIMCSATGRIDRGALRAAGENPAVSNLSTVDSPNNWSHCQVETDSITQHSRTRKWWRERTPSRRATCFGWA